MYVIKLNVRQARVLNLNLVFERKLEFYIVSTSMVVIYACKCV